MFAKDVPDKGLKKRKINLTTLFQRSVLWKKYPS